MPSFRKINSFPSICEGEGNFELNIINLIVSSFANVIFKLLIKLLFEFEGKVYVKVALKEENMVAMIVPLALQLLIENAIKHNGFSRKTPLNISISDGDEPFLTVTNNRRHRNTHSVSTGVGLENIRKRYAMLGDAEPEFIKTDTHFLAKIPLLGRNA